MSVITPPIPACPDPKTSPSAFRVYIETYLRSLKTDIELLENRMVIQGRLYQAGAVQDLPSGVETQLTYDTADNDSSGSAGADATNNRLKPLVSGAYFVFLIAGLSEAINDGCGIYIEIEDKDGNVLARNLITTGAASTHMLTTCCYEYFDGQDDYVIAKMYHNHGAAREATNGTKHQFGLFRIGGL